MCLGGVTLKVTSCRRERPFSFLFVFFFFDFPSLFPFLLVGWLNPLVLSRGGFHLSKEQEK